MKLTKPKKYQKEINKSINEHAKLLNHHVNRIFCRFANDIAKINSKYYVDEMKKGVGR